MNRRTFLRAIGIGAVASVAGPVLARVEVAKPASTGGALDLDAIFEQLYRVRSHRQIMFVDHEDCVIDWFHTVKSQHYEPSPEYMAALDEILKTP